MPDHRELVVSLDDAIVAATTTALIAREGGNRENEDHKRALSDLREYAVPFPTAVPDDALGRVSVPRDLIEQAARTIMDQANAFAKAPDASRWHMPTPRAGLARDLLAALAGTPEGTDNPDTQILAQVKAFMEEGADA